MMDIITNTPLPLSDAERQKIFSLQFYLGFDTSKFDQDSIIYAD